MRSTNGSNGQEMFSRFTRGLFQLSCMISSGRKTSCEFLYSDVVGSSAMTQLPWLTWFRWWSSASYRVPVCHIFQRIFSHRCPRHLPAQLAREWQYPMRAFPRPPPARLRQANAAPAPPSRCRGWSRADPASERAPSRATRAPPAACRRGWPGNPQAPRSAAS